MMQSGVQKKSCLNMCAFVSDGCLWLLCVVLMAEIMELDGPLRKAILAKADLDELEALLMSKGRTNMLADGQHCC